MIKIKTGRRDYNLAPPSTPEHLLKKRILNHMYSRYVASCNGVVNIHSNDRAWETWIDFLREELCQIGAEVEIESDRIDGLIFNDENEYLLLLLKL